MDERRYNPEDPQCEVEPKKAQPLATIKLNSCWILNSQTTFL